MVFLRWEYLRTLWRGEGPPGQTLAALNSRASGFLSITKSECPYFLGLLIGFVLFLDIESCYVTPLANSGDPPASAFNEPTRVYNYAWLLQFLNKHKCPSSGPHKWSSLVLQAWHSTCEKSVSIKGSQLDKSPRPWLASCVALWRLCHWNETQVPPTSGIKDQGLFVYLRWLA